MYNDDDADVAAEGVVLTLGEGQLGGSADRIPARAAPPTAGIGGDAPTITSVRVPIRSLVLRTGGSPTPLVCTTIETCVGGVVLGPIDR